MTVASGVSEAHSVDTTCPYCGVGCGVTARLGTQNDAPVVTGVSGSTAHPANAGRLCVKGSALHETMGTQGRLLHPRIGGCRTDWDTALDSVAAGFRRIIEEHGPDSVAFYLSGQLLTEDYYVANKLMKGFIGSANVDTNSRLCMASAVAGYKRAFGADAVPCSYEDLECCDLLVITGSNAAWTHPVLYQRISAAKKARPQMKVVVIDPRRTATCDIADLHLPVAPGGDAWLFSGLLRHLHEQGRTDDAFIREHSSGFAPALDAAPDREQTLKGSGLDEADLQQFYDWFARTQRTVTFYSQGINQSSTGTDKCNAIINCHLATGRIGRPGMGPFSITGQPNAMGGREVGGLSNQLAAHMDFRDDHVDRVSRFWGSDRVARRPGLKAVDLFQAIETGEVKAVWIMATNPAVSLPDSNAVRRALRRCELVVVSDCVEETDTTAFADILLPASTWGEKDGTVTNSERRISRQRPLVPAPGEARPDWWTLTQVARRMGFGDAFPYEAPHQIFSEHAALSAFDNEPGSPDRRCFHIGALAGLDREQYDRLQPVQWPVSGAAPHGTARLFTDRRFFTPDGRAHFLAVQPASPEHTVSVADASLPWILNTGRLRDQWHTMTRTGRAPRLLQHTEAPAVAMNPRDAASLGLKEGDLVRIRNSRGELLAAVAIDTGLRDGQLFMPIHWSETLSSHGLVDALAPAVTDPHSGQPQSKYIPVSLTPVPVRFWIHAISRRALDTTAFDYWVRVPVDGGWRYLAAVLPTGSDAELEATPQDVALRCTSGFAGGLQRIEYANTSGHDYRLLHCAAQSGPELAFYSHAQRPALPAAETLTGCLLADADTPLWRWLSDRHLHSGAQGRMVCSCHQVSERRIREAIDAGADSVEALGRQLRCGTQCGSCIPELKALLADPETDTVTI